MNNSGDRFEFSRGVKPRCEEESPDVIMFKIQYQHPLFSGPLEHVPAMNRVKQLVRDANITGRVFAKSIKYEFWEVDEILRKASKSYKKIYQSIQRLIKYERNFKCFL